ncbi:endonuclease domain-containing protein [Kitasatospora cineracea]|uniref:Recombination endonuclease VII n=1 Tax=Kitasatospora cineracea TaxID=88074 RepID=A0A3N4RJL3_9ACTN|nr:endonuclease domain-containing protein [Kitasatospora cineracea]RPE27250.1 recombination endonuclease VII [Kitasatospora cineracea]
MNDRAEARPACWKWPLPTAEPGPGPEAGTGQDDLTAEAAEDLREILADDPEERDRALLVAWQGGRCAICNRRRELVDDHDHATGLLRGLLCSSCNTIEGRSTQPIFVRYRERPPTAILQLRIRYWNMYTLSYAEPSTPPITAASAQEALDRLVIPAADETV